MPEQIKKKKTQYDKTMQEIANYLNYIKLGNFSRIVSEALQQAEANSENLKQEMRGLKYQQKNTFKAPPMELIKHRLWEGTYYND